jgi:hypothetical protein
MAYRMASSSIKRLLEDFEVVAAVESIFHVRVNPSLSCPDSTAAQAWTQ